MNKNDATTWRNATHANAITFTVHAFLRKKEQFVHVPIFDSIVTRWL